MIISSEHHDLIEEYQAAVTSEGVAIKAFNDYCNTPNVDKNMAAQLFSKWEEISNKASKLRAKLNEVAISQH